MIGCGTVVLSLTGQWVVSADRQRATGEVLCAARDGPRLHCPTQGLHSVEVVGGRSVQSAFV